MAAAHQLLETSSYLSHLTSYTRTTPSGQFGPEKDKQPDVPHMFPFWFRCFFVHLKRATEFDALRST